jgi:acyl-coenzyme A thioesterase PaaI-like protein
VAPAADLDPPYDPVAMAAVTELGTALRELVGASISTTVAPAELTAAAAQARELTARLSASLRPLHQVPALDDLAAFRRVYSPVTGVGSALALPLVVRKENGGVVAEGSFGATYEGPPGYLHGGVSGLVMDQLLGAAVIASGTWGMTVRLELDYRRPVPLATPLVLRAQATENAGRRTVTTGTIAAADAPGRPLVAARGVFVAPRRDQTADLFQAVVDSSGRQTTPGRPTDATALRGPGTEPA